MHRKDGKGRSLQDILESGASYKHSMHLLNGSIILHRLSPSDRNKVAWGTTGNEALHNQIKGVASTTVQQHATRVCTRMKAFAIGKMLAHNAAAYSPATHQQTEGDVLCTIQGALMRNFFPAFGTSPVPGDPLMPPPISKVKNNDMQ